MMVQPDKASREWTLRQRNGQDFFLRLEPGETATVGRDLTCELSILDAGISRHHATFQLDGENLWLEDLHSQNGTYINAERVQRGQVHSSDIVTFGRISLTITERPVVSEDLDPLRRLPQEDLAQLLRMARELGAEQDKTTIFQQLLENALQSLKADRGVVLLWEETRGHLHPVAAAPHDLFQVAGSLVNGSLAASVIASRRPRLLNQPSALGAASAMLTPLLARERAMGVLYLDRSSARRGFDSADVAFFNAFTWVTSLPLSVFTRLRESRDSNERLESILSERTSEIARLHLKTSSTRALAKVESEWLHELERALMEAASRFEQAILDADGLRKAGAKSLRLARLITEAVRHLTQWHPERMEEIHLPSVVLELRGLDKGRRAYKLESGVDLGVICDCEEFILVIRLLTEAVFDVEAEALLVTGSANSARGIVSVRIACPQAAVGREPALSGGSLERLAERMAEQLSTQRLNGQVEVAPDGSWIELCMPQPLVTRGETIVLPPQR